MGTQKILLFRGFLHCSDQNKTQFPGHPVHLNLSEILRVEKINFTLLVTSLSDWHSFNKNQRRTQDIVLEQNLKVFS